MRLNVVLTDEQNKAISDRADAEGIPRAEVIRQAISSHLEPAPCRSGADDAEKIQELSRALDAVTQERNQAIEVLARLTAENDRMQGEIITLNGDLGMLKIEAAATDRSLNEKRDEVSWLRGQVALLNEKMTPPALPEQAGPGRKPWWSRIFG